MKIQNALLLIDKAGMARVVDITDKHVNKSGAFNVGASFSGYGKLSTDQQVIHLLGFALNLMEIDSNIKAKQVLDALEKIEEVNEALKKCVHYI